jgi:hypothetical protein
MTAPTVAYNSAQEKKTRPHGMKKWDFKNFYTPKNDPQKYLFFAFFWRTWTPQTKKTKAK